MLDSVPSVQQTAALALGRLADHSDDLAEAVVKEDILPQLVHSLASQNVSISSLSVLHTGCPRTQPPPFRGGVCERPRRTSGSPPLNVRVCFGLSWQFAWGLLQNLRALYHKSNPAFVFSLSAPSEAQTGGGHCVVLVIKGTLQFHLIHS